MPSYWYNIRDVVVKDEDSEEDIIFKNHNREIIAANKPYFMTYIYPTLKSQYNNYIKNSNYGAIMRFGEYGIHSIDELYAYENKTDEMIDFLNYYEKYMPVGNNPCVVNRICWLFEKEFDGYLSKKYEQTEFDYNILKSGVEYSKRDYIEIAKLYDEYLKRVSAFHQRAKVERIDTDEYQLRKQRFAAVFKERCERICVNEYELCDIILDLCYNNSTSKQFAWDICGNTILKNILEHNKYIIQYPKLVDKDGDFEYCGNQFKMNTLNVKEYMETL